MSTLTAVSTTSGPITTGPSLARLHLMRAGYLLMAVGLALVKWPLLVEAATLPVYEGVTLCLLTAMSLLAILGLRYPVTMLPVLMFEALWKLLWLGLVALPHAVDGTMGGVMAEVAVSCSLVVLILVAIPWRFAWQTFVVEPGSRWR
jgi:hypothetical protein